MDQIPGISLQGWWIERQESIRFLGQIIFITVMLGFFSTSHAGAGILYITNRESGDLAILNESSPKIQELIPIGEQPWGVGVTPNNTFGCVSYMGGVAILDAKAKKIVRHVSFHGQGLGVAISPDGARCYVAVTSVDSRILSIERKSGKIQQEVGIGGRAFGVYISPDGRTLYVPEHSGYALSVIETKPLRLLQRIPLTDQGEYGYNRPHYLTMTPDGKTLYLPFVGQTLVSIDTTTFAVSTSPLSIDAHQHGIAISPDGSRIYLANNVLGGDGSLSEIDTKTLKELRRLPLGRHHEQVLVDSEGRLAYLSGGFVMGYKAHDFLTVVNLETGDVLQMKTKGLAPFHIFRAP